MQARLEMSTPGDAAELEADRVAEQVMQKPAGTDHAGEAPAGGEEHTVRERVQTKITQAAGGNQTEAPPAVHHALAASGQPLAASARAFMESRFGQDFGQVRVHTGSLADEAAGSIQAEAYTVDHDIVFGRGRYEPDSPQGRLLLAHELTHVMQQRAGGQSAPHVARKSPPPPKPQKFSILGTDFKAVTNPTSNAVTISPTGKSANGWTFTAAAADTFTATRSPARHEYVHANGSSEALTHKTTVKAPANTAVTVDPVLAILSNPPQLSFEIKLVAGDNIRAARTKSETVFAASVEKIELAAPPTKLVPADGDVIQLGLGGGAYVWSTIQTGAAATPAQTPGTVTQPPTNTPSSTVPSSTPTQLPTPTPATNIPTTTSTTPTTTTPNTPASPATQATSTPPAAATTVQGFFDIGKLTIYKGRLGFTSLALSEAARVKAITDLQTVKDPARQITAEEAAAFKTVTLIEHDFAGIQNYDSAVLSFGFAQWTVPSDLPRMLNKVPADVFEKYLGRYGLKVGAPVRALDAAVAKYITSGRSDLGVRNKSEGALFLNNKDVVSSALLKAANDRVIVFDKQLQDLAAAKADLGSKDAKVVGAAKTKITNSLKMLKGLPGAKQDKDVSAMADALIKSATDARAAAKDLVDNAVSVEVLRSAEWVLRFEMLGRDPAAQNAQIKQARETFNHVLSLTVEGVPNSQLLRSKRARAALLSSYFNNPSGTTGFKNKLGVWVGMKGAVIEYRDKKVAAAKKAAADAAAKAGQQPPQPVAPTEADWKAFPWLTTDARWVHYTSAEIATFEAIAIVKMTMMTTDPKRRRDFIGTIPD